MKAVRTTKVTNVGEKLEEVHTDRESLESGRGSPYAFPSHLESVGGYEETVWTRCISKKTMSPRATTRQWDRLRHEL